MCVPPNAFDTLLYAVLYILSHDRPIKMLFGENKGSISSLISKLLNVMVQRDSESTSW